jgi:hypothetical protein
MTQRTRTIFATRKFITQRRSHMPLLEINQAHQITASVRLDESTAAQIDQYAAFLRTSADEVVDKALAYVFARDRDFQEYLRTRGSTRAAQSLRIRRAPHVRAVNGHNNGGATAAGHVAKALEAASEPHPHS